MSEQSGQLPVDIVKVEAEEDDERTSGNSSNTMERPSEDDKDREMLKAVASLLSNGPWLSCGTDEGESLAEKLVSLGERLVGWKEWERLGRSKVEENRKLTQRLEGAELQFGRVKESKAELRKTYEQEVERKQKAEKEVVELKEKIAQTSVTGTLQDVEVQGTASTGPDRDRGISVLQQSNHSAPVIAARIEIRTSSEESRSEEEGGMLQQELNSDGSCGNDEDFTGCEEAVPLDAIAGSRRSNRSVARKTVENPHDSEASDKDSDDGGDDTAQPAQSRRFGRTLDGGKKRFQCDRCEVVLASQWNLNRHMEKIHGGNEQRGRFPCYCCDEVFLYKTKFLQHLKSHPDEQSYGCKTCGVILKTRNILQTHVKIHDPNQKKFACSTCSMEFVTSKNLNMHLVTHRTEKPFKCSQCPQRFKRADELKSHHIIHSELRPFQCKLCEKSFRRKNDLEVHMRVHTGERPYSCEICDKTFSDLSHLHRHIKTHQGDQGKLHQCPDCSLKFFQKYDCLRHQQSRHKSELAPPVAEGEGQLHAERSAESKRPQGSRNQSTHGK